MQPRGPDEPAATNTRPKNAEGAPPPVHGEGTAITGPLPPTAGQRLAPAAASPPLSVLKLLLALRRRWLLALALGLLLAPAAAAAVWYARPVTYTATTKLHVAAVPYRVVYDMQEGRNDFGGYQRAQVALVRTRLVLNSALRVPQVASLPSVRDQVDPVEWLERLVQADFSVAPEVLRISITGQEAEDLKVLVGAVRDAYLHEIVNKESNLRLGRLDRLKKLHAEYDGILRGKRETLKKMAKSLGSGDRKVLGTKQELTLKLLNELQGELLRRQSELRTADLELKIARLKEKAAADASIPESAVEELINADSEVVRHGKEIAEREREIALLKGRARKPESEAGYKRAVASLAAASKGREARRQQIRQAAAEKLRERLVADVRATRFQQQDKVAFLTEMEKLLVAEIDRRGKDVKVLKEGTVDLEWLQDEIAHVDATTKEIARQKQVLEVEIEAPARVSLLEEAFVQPAQSASSRARMAGGAGLAAFAAALFGVALLEFRARRVGSVDEVIHGLKMKLVGALPVVPRRARGAAPGTKNVYWQNQLTESVDAIRTTLLNAARFEGMRVIMVTSAVGGEGKTLLSCHLATSLARAGCKTLLIDGDLRRPNVHRLFGLSAERGLGEVLLGEAAVADAIQPCLMDGLSVMAAGQGGSEAVHALSRGGLAQALQELRGSYDFIVIDSAPVLPVADSQTIGQHVDGVVFSVMRDVSRIPEVYAACERLASLRIRILGAVINGTSGSAYGSGYSYSSPSAAAKKA